MQRGLPLRICRHLTQKHRKASSLAPFTSYFLPNDKYEKIEHISSRRISIAGIPENYRQTEALSVTRLLTIYVQLAKSRLTVLNVLVAMSGVALSPLASTAPLFATAVGTTLCSASANAFNQIVEVPLDAQMARTRSRPLPRRSISSVHAAGFAVVTGIAGPVILYTFLNPTAALLGLGNIVLYAGVYTWMKRKTIYNTWVGSIVGAVPPLIGWSACGGHLIPTAEYPIHFFLPAFLTNTPIVDLSLVDNPLAPFALFMLLFSWQFPHFNSLSYMVRGSYAQAGYRMLAVLNPSKNALVAFRHAMLLVPICSILIPISGLTTWMFAFTSLVPNIICARAAWFFWRKGGEKQARIMWRHNLWYLPAILGLMMFHKQGMDWSKWLGITSDESNEEDANKL